MRWHALFIFFVTQFAVNLTWAADFTFPTGLSIDDIPKIVHNFNSGFLTRTPVSMIGQDRYYSELAFRLHTIDTTKVSKMGIGSRDHDVQVRELSFSRRLPYDIECGIHTSLTAFDRDINTFGGYLRWGFRRYAWGGFSFLGHGASASYQNLIGTNLYGGSLNLDVDVWMIRMSLGTGVVRSTNTFDASLFNTTAGSRPDLTYSRAYGHQSIKASYVWNNFAFSAQGDWLKEFFSSADLTYLF